MIKVSILVPIYNVEKYLSQCMDSILQQTLKEIEIICVDDGSTDASSSILDIYATKDSRIKVLHKENTGYGDSMNRALEIARGEYIGIVESDDFIEKEMYERLYAIAVEKRLDFLKTDHYHFGNGEKVYAWAYDSSVYHKVFKNNENKKKFNNTTMAIWAGLYKNSFLKENDIKFLPTAGASYQDISFMFKVYVCAQRGYVLKEAYVNYRIDNESSSVKSKEKVYCVCDEIAECKRFLENRRDHVVFEPCLTKIMFYVYRWNIKRISAKYLEEFIYYISKEFKERKQQKCLEQKLFTAEEWLQYTLISDYTEKSIQFILEEKVKAEVNNNRIYKVGCHRLFEDSRNIYIYGAGKIGKRLGKYIKGINKDCDIKYVVSNKTSNSDCNCSEIEDRILNKNYPIFIAVINLYDQAEMISNAKKQGFKEIYCVDSNLLKLLRNE